LRKKGQKIQKIYNDQITELIIYTKINFKKKTQNLLINQNWYYILVFNIIRSLIVYQVQFKNEYKIYHIIDLTQKIFLN